MDIVALERFDMFAVIVNGWRADCPVLDQVTIVEGRRLQPGDRGRVMLGKVLADNIGKHVGDTIEFYAEQFEIVGIFDSFSVYETGAIFVLLDELQRLMDRPRKVTGYVVQATRPGDAAAVEELRKCINGLDPNIRAVAVSEFVRNISQIRVIRAATWVTSVIAVAIGIVGVLNTMITSVFERTSEIGTLRAIGWHKRRVMSMVIVEVAAVQLARGDCRCHAGRRHDAAARSFAAACRISRRLAADRGGWHRVPCWPSSLAFSVPCTPPCGPPISGRSKPCVDANRRWSCCGGPVCSANRRRNLRTPS